MNSCIVFNSGLHTTELKRDGKQTFGETFVYIYENPFAEHSAKFPRIVPDSSYVHIHNWHGTEKIGATTFVNASTCTEKYEPTNKPIVLEIDDDSSD